MQRIPQLAVAATIFPRCPHSKRVDTSLFAMVQRGNHPGRGQWSLPGGKVKWGETLREAATREVWEELGIHATPLLVGSNALTSFATTDAIHGDYHFGIAHAAFFVDCVDDRLPTLLAGDDAMAAAWFFFEGGKPSLLAHAASALPFAGASVIGPVREVVEAAARLPRALC